MPQFRQTWDSTMSSQTVPSSDVIVTSDGTQGFFPEVLTPIYRQFIGGVCNVQLGAIINGGAGYTEGVYTDVELVRLDGANEFFGGRDLKVTITVDATGAVTDVVKTAEGSGYKTGDTLVLLDIAQVGGTGSGFRIAVDDADASLGIIYDTYQANSKSAQTGFLLGVERTDQYVHGIVQYSPNPRSSSYNYLRTYGVYNFSGPSSSNNYYSNYSVYGSNYDWQYWGVNDTHKGDLTGYHNDFIWSTDPGNQYFVWADERHDYTQGFFRAVQLPGYNYPPVEALSQWFYFYSTGITSSTTCHPLSATGTTDQIWDIGSRTISYPSSLRGYFFNNNAVRSDMFYLGVIPPDLHWCYPSDNQSPRQATMSNGVDLRLIRYGNGLWVKERT